MVRERVTQVLACLHCHCANMRTLAGWTCIQSTACVSHHFRGSNSRIIKCGTGPVFRMARVHEDRRWQVRFVQGGKWRPESVCVPARVDTIQKTRRAAVFRFARFVCIHRITSKSVLLAFRFRFELCLNVLGDIMRTLQVIYRCTNS